jgi:hypothetical protein
LDIDEIDIGDAIPSCELAKLGFNDWRYSLSGRLRPVLVENSVAQRVKDRSSLVKLKVLNYVRMVSDDELDSHLNSIMAIVSL